MDEIKLTKPLGPYSHFRTNGTTVYTSGQVAVDVEGRSYADAPIAVQTKLVMENLSAVLAAAGSSFSKALKINIYLKNIEDFDQMNEVYRSFFPDGVYPARCCVEIARLSGGFKIEIDAEASV